MSQNETLGASFSIDVTNLKAGLAQANRLIRESESEFRAAAAGMDNWADSQEGLESRIQHLTKTQDIQQKKVKALQSEYNRLIAEGLDPTSAAAIKLRTDINKEKEALAKTESELRKQTKALEELEEGAEDAGNGLEDLGEKAEDAGGSFTVMRGAAADLVSSGIQALVGACKDGVSALMGLAEETREYRDNIAKLETAFETAAHTTEEATQTYRELYSVFGEEDRAVEAAQQIAKLAKNEEQMVAMTNIATGVWATFGDSLPAEALMEAINSTSKIGTVQGNLADALEWSGINLDNFNASLEGMATEEERAAHILETLNGLYGEAADGYRENNAEIIKAREANAEYTESMAELGEAMQPVQTELTVLKTELVKELTPTIKQDVIPAIRDFIKQLKDTGALQKFSTAVSKIATKVLPMLADVISFLVDNMKPLAIGIGLVVAALRTMSVVNTVKTALVGATGAMAKLNAVMAANPVGAVVTAIAALVAVVGLLVESVANARDELDYTNDAFMENIEAANKWRSAMDAATDTLGDFSDFANAAGETTASLTSKMADAQQAITDIWAKAFEENRALRASEIEAIRKYNEEYIAAQNELVKLEQQKFKAQIDAWQWKLDNMEMSEEQEQGILNSLQAAREEYNNAMSELVANELVLLEQRYSNNQISEEEYNKLKEAALAKQQEYADAEILLSQSLVDNALEQQAKRFEIDTTDYSNRTHYFKTYEELMEHHAALVQQINEDETLGWWDKQFALDSAYRTMRNDAASFLAGNEVFWTDYNFLTDQSIQANERAFFNWITNSKENGVELDKTSRETAAKILAAYASLPEELEESGLNALRGYAAGMAEEYPELENAAEMDMDELLKAMNSALGIQSPSKKTKQAGKYIMEGLGNGMNEKLPDIRKVVTTIGTSLINGFTKMFDMHSPSRVSFGWGANIVHGLTNGIVENTPAVVSEVKNQVRAIEDAYSFGDISSSVTAGAQSARSRNGGADESPAAARGSVTVNQNNYYSQAHSRIELYKTKQATAAAVRLVVAGA